MSIPRRSLPPLPSPENLRKQAKSRLSLLRQRQVTARLAEAQQLVAREYGFPNWTAMLAEVTRRQESLAGHYRAIRQYPIALPESLTEDEHDPVNVSSWLGPGRRRCSR